MARYIDKIGVELELGVDKNTSEDSEWPEVPKFRNTYDGSLRSRSLPDGYGTREYVSEPCDYKSDWDNSDMSELEAGIRKLYKKHRAANNRSMGTHIHVSFYKDFYYYALASEKFRDYFIQELKDSDLYRRNPRLQDRVRGNNQYCQPIPSHEVLQQYMETGAAGSDRYRHFVYRSETLEFRVFPAFDTHIEVREAVNLITSIINSYLFNKKYEIEEEDVVEDEEVFNGLDDSQNPEEELKEVIEHV